MLKKPLNLIILAVIAGAVLFSFYQIFKSVPLSTSERTDTKELKKIGVVYFKQQAEALEGMKEGLKELGYKNILYKEFTTVPGPDMTASIEADTKKLVEEGVDLIYAPLEHQAAGAIKVTKEMESDIPIVFLTNFHDPIKYGLAKSFKSSGNNATGIALNIVEMVQKQLEFLKTINPKIEKVGVFGQGFMVPPIGAELLEEVKLQAPRFDITIREYTTSVPPPETETAWYKTANKMKPGDIDALYHIAGHHFFYQETAELELAIRLGIPMVAPVEDLPNGGHFGYSSNFKAAGKQAAKIIDKIFKGAEPSDIPIEFTEQIDLVLHPARAYITGIEFPESMLSIADVKIGD